MAPLAANNCSKAKVGEFEVPFPWDSSRKYPKEGIVIDDALILYCDPPAEVGKRWATLVVHFNPNKLSNEFIDALVTNFFNKDQEIDCFDIEAGTLVATIMFSRVLRSPKRFLKAYGNSLKQEYIKILNIKTN